MFTSPIYTDLDTEKTYTPTTLDNTTDNIGEVKIKQLVDVNRKTVYTLNQLDKTIANLNNQLQRIQIDITDYTNLRKEVETAAKTVTLKSKT